MVVGLVAAYLVAPLVVLTWWWIDLWAKSYDFPVAQAWAKVALATTVAFAAGGLMLSATAAVTWPMPRAVVAVCLACVPLLTLFVWCVRELDWRLVYLAAVAGTLAPLGLGVTRVALETVVPPTLVSLVLVGLAGWREVPTVRLKRYERMLGLCSCCGYQQKAVHELCGLGSVGEDVIAAYLRKRSLERGQRVWGFIPGSVVEKELLRRRPTRG